jgi:hypothetical protein
MKSIQLMEHGPDGRICKNENYTYEKLKRKIRLHSGKFFYHKLWGGLRCVVLDQVFVALGELTDLDQPGKGSPKNK